MNGLDNSVDGWATQVKGVRALQQLSLATSRHQTTIYHQHSMREHQAHSHAMAAQAQAQHDAAMTQLQSQHAAAEDAKRKRDEENAQYWTTAMATGTQQWVDLTNQATERFKTSLTAQHKSIQDHYDSLGLPVAPHVASADQDLPFGWRRFSSQQHPGRSFFYHHASRHSQWELPTMQPPEPSTAPPASAFAPAPPSLTAIPAGANISPMGSTYSHKRAHDSPAGSSMTDSPVLGTHSGKRARISKQDSPPQMSSKSPPFSSALARAKSNPRCALFQCPQCKAFFNPSLHSNCKTSWAWHVKNSSCPASIPPEVLKMIAERVKKVGTGKKKRESVED
jgi:hypothetical protein